MSAAEWFVVGVLTWCAVIAAAILLVGINKPSEAAGRKAALEEAAKRVDERAQAWWSIHCASNRHMETTRKAHDDLCALAIAIRAMAKEIKHD